MENLLDPRNSSSYYKELVRITDEIQKKINNDSINEALDSDFMNKDLSEFLKELKKEFYDKFSYLKSSYIEYIDALHFFIFDDQHIKTKSGYNVCGDVIDIVTVEIDEQVIERIKKFMKQYGYVLELKRTVDFAVQINNKPNLHLIFSNQNPQSIVLPQEPDFLYFYHLTLNKNIESIIKNGLLPSGRSGYQGVYYQPRIFFNPTQQIAQDYYTENQNEHLNIDMSEHFSFIVIKQTYITRFCELYVDPAYPGAVYVTKPIPYDKDNFIITNPREIL